jgi:hypothetical protein
MELIYQWMLLGQQHTRNAIAAMRARDPGSVWDAPLARAHAGQLFGEVNQQCPNGNCGKGYFWMAYHTFLTEGGVAE